MRFAAVTVAHYLIAPILAATQGMLILPILGYGIDRETNEKSDLAKSTVVTGLSTALTLEAILARGEMGLGS